MSEMTEHLPLDVLLAHWLHDSDAAATDAIDEHLMRCDACGHALDELIALGAGVRVAFRNGAVTAMMSRAFVERLARQGLRVREYRLPHNGSVNCTVAPDDDLLVARLEAPLEGVRRLDAVVQLSLEPGAEHRMVDVPFDAPSGEVLYVPRVAAVKRMPANTLQVTLLAVEGAGSREVGRYTFRHEPWAAQ